MKCVTATLLLLAAAGSISAGGSRRARASAGAYSGYINGQHYGGTYHTPDNGPTIFNRFGDDNQGSASNDGAYGHGSNNPGNSGNSGNYAPNFGFGPGVPPFSNPAEFNNFFQGYFKTLSNNLASVIPPTPDSSLVESLEKSIRAVSEMESVFQKNIQDQRAAWEAAQQAFQTASSNRFGGSPEYSYNFNDNAPGASASASFGPGGGHQSANIYPESAASPNINTRFQSDGPKPGGSYGVSTSSFASSSDIGGKKTSHKEAQTTINDNGKVTTYVVRN